MGNMKKNERKMIVMFMAPVVLIYLIFFLYPTIRTVHMSFYKVRNLASPVNEWSFVGLKNYMDLTKNPLFVISYKNIMAILFIGGLGVFVLAFLFAVVLQKMKTKKFFRAAIYLPNVITPVALVVMWTQYVFNSRFGFLKNFFGALGLDSLAAIPWTSPDWAFTSMMVAFCFGSVGYYMVIIMAAMDKIPKDFYECADLEGAGSFTKFFRITLPLMKDILRTAITFWCLGAINFFLWSRVFSSSGLDPKTLSPANLMFNMIFGGSKTQQVAEHINVGMGAAIGVTLCASVILVFVILNVVISKEKYEY